MSKIMVGADPWGMELKEAIKAHLESKGMAVMDVGTFRNGPKRNYYDVAADVARALQQGKAERGLLFCGTGMGVALVANKFKGVYAGLVESEYTARMCKVINNTNVLAMGGMLISEHKAKMAVDQWLGAAHTEGLDPELAAFLKQSLVEIGRIENDNMR
jgi:ribose 5-phosphate isomerase B